MFEELLFHVKNTFVETESLQEFLSLFETRSTLNACNFLRTFNIRKIGNDVKILMEHFGWNCNFQT